jgi:hypothetical protein
MQNANKTNKANKAKINYVAILQAILNGLLISIVFLKNTSVKTYFYLKEYLKPQAKPTIKPPIKLEPEYNECYAKDIAFYKTMTPEDANVNIDPIMYDYDNRKTLFEEVNNITEKQWKSRLLFENTHRGNIIMYYDAFRMTFAYYSDEQIVPFKALYHAALKYVVIYRCRDFFIDMDTFPQNPMIEVLRKEDDTLKTKTKTNAKEPSKNAVFAKLKDYRNAPVGQKKDTQSAKAQIFTNKFVRIGKMCEFNILQKPPNKKIEAVNALLFSDKPMSSATDFFYDDEELSLQIPSSEFEEKRGKIEENPEENINPFSTDQPKMSSYQLFKLMKKNREPTDI